jgi:hypothetical protein
VDVRGDQEDPRDQGDADGENERVDDGGAVAPGVSAFHEDQQPCDERWVDRQVDRVAERRELHLDPEELGIAVRVEISGEEEKLADDEEEPCGAGPRPMEIDPDADCDRGREPQ